MSVRHAADAAPFIGTRCSVSRTPVRFSVPVTDCISPPSATTNLTALADPKREELKVHARRVVLVAVLVGGKIFGITGVLIALPATAAGRVCLDYFLERRSRVLAMGGPPGEVLAPDNDAARSA